MTNLTKKKETVFTKLNNFTIRNKHMIMSVFMIGFFVFLQNEIVFADDGAAFARDILKKTLDILIKVMFIGTGALSIIFGSWELGVTTLGQNPDAKNKAIAGFGIGIVLITLGITFLTQVDAIVSFFIS